MLIANAFSYNDITLNARQAPLQLDSGYVSPGNFEPPQATNGWDVPDSEELTRDYQTIEAIPPSGSSSRQADDFSKELDLRLQSESGNQPQPAGEGTKNGRTVTQYNGTTDRLP